MRAKGTTERGVRVWAAALGVAIVAVLSWTGCVQGPDAASGDDAFRHQAVQIPLDQPVPDTFSWPSSDRTDWKWFILPQDGLLTVNVHFVNLEAAAHVEVFDTYGKVVAKRIKERNRDEHLQFSEPVNMGRYFLRVMAFDEGDESEYTVLLTMNE